MILKANKVFCIVRVGIRHARNTRRRTVKLYREGAGSARPRVDAATVRYVGTPRGGAPRKGRGSFYADVRAILMVLLPDCEGGQMLRLAYFGSPLQLASVVDGGGGGGGGGGTAAAGGGDHSEGAWSAAVHALTLGVANLPTVSSGSGERGSRIPLSGRQRFVGQQTMHTGTPTQAHTSPH